MVLEVAIVIIVVVVVVVIVVVVIVVVVIVVIVNLYFKTGKIPSVQNCFTRYPLFTLLYTIYKIAYLHKSRKEVISHYNNKITKLQKVRETSGIRD